MNRDTYAAVALSRLPKVGPKLFSSLLAHFGSAAEVLAARPAELREVSGVADRIVAAFSGDEHRNQADNILEFADRHAIHILCRGAPDYPERLNDQEAAPPVLYHAGTTELDNPRALAIVGTRQMTSHGGRQIERLLEPLADFDPLVVSGLAYGVDVYAHRRALRLGLPTLGVMGSGHHHVYPHVHGKVAREMMEQRGGILTEYPFWIKPERMNFPARNRIVAMLADLVVVVESNRSGGSMITARMASDLGRKLGACPGRAGDPLSAGCNELIKSGRAHLLESGQDVIDLLKWTGATRGTQRQLFDDLDAGEKAIVGQLHDREAVGIDDLRYELALPPARLASSLLMLEVKGIITALPGQRYRLVG